MSTELIINASLPETRIALLENGEIQELLIERASGKGIVGNIYKGRVTRVLPGMQAAFVDIGLEKAAFLYVDDVYVHSEIWEEEEGPSNGGPLSEVNASEEAVAADEGQSSQEAAAAAEGEQPAEQVSSAGELAEAPAEGQAREDIGDQDAGSVDADRDDYEQSDEDSHDDDDDDSDEEDDDDESQNPVGMGDDLKDPSNHPEGTVAAEDNIGNRADSGPKQETQFEARQDEQPGEERNDSEQGQDDGDLEGTEGQEGQEGQSSEEQASDQNNDPAGQNDSRRRHRRGRRGGRNRRRSGDRDRGPRVQAGGPPPVITPKNEQVPQTYYDDQVSNVGNETDRPGPEGQVSLGDKPEMSVAGEQADSPRVQTLHATTGGKRPEFQEQRLRDRRIRPKTMKPGHHNVNIQDLLKEGQEVLVQVAKDPIATKGARLTCHISLPGRHLVCMPTIDHVGVSRRIERDEERRRLREFVERNRPRHLGFIVRTASGKAHSEKRIKQDIDYLTRLWNEIREKASNVSAPALVYEDLNSVLRSIRDWVTEEIDKIIVDSRYHFNEIQRFVSHFMPALKQKVDLYHGDIPIFDAYNISTELSRALERKVWLKSGGYIVIDQAEALVAIDVNTGRYVGKKNLEDTILKTNLEAVQEIAYQLRLRNCGGIIILDLIDMEKEENRLRVYRALEEALKKDRARPTILKISELGLVEMTRKRTRDTIIRTLCEPCSHCEGKGFIKGKQTVAYEVLREIEREGIERSVGKILVQAHPDVIDILAIEERETLDHLERRYRKQIYLQGVTDFHPEQFEVVGDKKESAERGRDQLPGRDRDRDRDRNRGRRDHRQGHGRGDGRREPVAAAPVTHVITPVGAVGPVITPAPIVHAAAEEPIESQQGVEAAPSAEEFAGQDNEGQPQQGQGEGETSQQGPGGGADDDFFDEEDRLAFLRAQAAQDAALAGQSVAGGARPHTGQNRPKGGGGGGGGRNNWNNRNNRNRRRRGRGGSAGGGGGRFHRDNRGAGFGGANAVREDRPASTASNTSDSSGGDGGGSGGASGSGNGGGDHSQPPT